MQGDEAAEIVGEVSPMFGQAAREGVAGRIMRVADVIDAVDQRSAEHLAVADDAANRHAAEVDAMVAALAADQAGLGPVALGTVIAQRDLQRRIDGFRAGIGEEHVAEGGGCDID